MTPRSWQEARRYVLPVLLTGAALGLARRREAWLALGLAGSVTWFFRDPERRLSADPAVVYAAADGTVTGVEHAAHEPWLPGDSGTRVSTFLALHNVHVNRSPVSGRIAAVEEVRGAFAPAFLGRSNRNQQNRMAVDGRTGRVVVVQIAGMVARKIACWVEPRDTLAAGQRFGLIHFGSRTDVLLPTGSVDVLVSPGDRVRAGLTPIARYSAKEGDLCATT